MNIVISQSMYFPWVGLLEQIQLADVFVHYDDVQFTRGFYNRVQVKTDHGTSWMTVPLRNQHRGQRIDEVQLDDRVDWREQHRTLLGRSYKTTPFLNDMLGLFDRVVAMPTQTLADLSRNSMLALASYFEIDKNCEFQQSTGMAIESSSSRRLLDIVLELGGNVYITGLGALKYLDHDLFENAGVVVRYMDYQQNPYPQLHGGFTPFVTALDLVANCGKSGRHYISSQSTHWRTFVEKSP